MASIIEKRERGETTEVVRYWKTTGIASEHGVIQPGEFQMFLDWFVKDGLLTAGAIKPSDIYTNELNPFAKTQG